MTIRKIGVIVYLSAIICFLEWCAIRSGINGVALSTAIGGVCFLGGLLFDVKVVPQIFKKIFHTNEVKHEKKEIKTQNLP